MRTISLKIFIIFLLLSGMLTVGATPDRHHLVKTSFTGTETFAGVGGGTVYEKGDKTIFKDFVEYAIEEMSDPRVSGDFTIELDAVFDTATMSGPFWGPIQLKNGGGTWTIYGVGYIYADGHAWARTWGYGQGDYKGMTVFWEATSVNRMASSTVSGYILEYK